MIVCVAVGEVRPGYELWRPNREKAGSVTTKFVLVFLLAATAALSALIAITGFSLMTGGSGMSVMCLIYAALYAFFAFLVFRWSRGILPVAAARCSYGDSEEAFTDGVERGATDPDELVALVN